MTNDSGLSSLANIIHQLEPTIQNATLTILDDQHREQVTQLLLPALQKKQPAAKITVESSSGEFKSHLALLHVNNNKYTIAKDYVETYLSAINSYSCRIPANASGILVYHHDYPGVVRNVSQILADHKINISKLNVSRETRGKLALLVSLTDEPIPPDAVNAIAQLSHVTRVIPLTAS